MTLQERKEELLDMEYIQQSYKQTTIGTAWTLVDTCQYWQDSQPTDYFIALQIHNENFVNIALMQSIDESTIKMLVCLRYVLNVDIKRVTEDLWMSSQHLCIKEWDGRNIPWVLSDAQAWLAKKYSKHVTISVDQKVKEIKL